MSITASLVIAGLGALLLAIGAVIGGGSLYRFAVLAISVKMTAVPYTTTQRSR